ncbi:RNA polymerase sigma factor [Polyangium spumosum]|uniref:Sigma-70 family RNA polymerase sigma factor n=1 Tax=Polyangium spumosum TaxID=889282 RepID=A0A6N7PJ40_9BACT|nr:sigma-70 family RNA polymerase sigma factor [Polyangium spumosum]MRG92019.1 sigma-70 family RNA polymerase sigma factor [Polyangium spumosum]
MAPPDSTTLPGGRAQFEAAVRPVLPRLYRFCLALTADHDRADDLLQNTLVKAYAHAASFEGRSDLVVWISGIARHEYLETRRTEARRSGLFDRFAGGEAFMLRSRADERKTPEALVNQKEHASLLLACLETLPEALRDVIMLCDIEGVGYERAAAVLGIPKGTVKSRHARGRARLRLAYERQTPHKAQPHSHRTA